jgi:hypothetical protein
MPHRMTIRSRFGNQTLAAIGVTYALVALALFIWHVAAAWLTASVVDRLVELLLVLAAMTGIWFVAIARDNLGGGPRLLRPRH